MSVNNKKFLVGLDLSQNQLVNAVIQGATTAPSGAVKGQIYYDTTGNATYVYNGSAWEKHLVGGGVTSNDISGTIPNNKLANSTITLGSSTLTLGSATTTVAGLTLTLPTFGGTGANFNGSTSGTITVVANATAGTNTLTLPPVTGNVVTTGDTSTVTNAMLAGSIANSKLANSSATIGSTSVALGSTVTTIAGLTLTSPAFGTSFTLPGTTSGTTTITGAPIAGTTAIAFPATSGTVITSGDTGTVTNNMLLGSIANAKLANSSVTIGSTSVALGSTITGVTGLTLTSSSIAGAGITINGSTSGSTIFKAAATAGATTITLPAVTGTVVTTGDTASVTNTMLANASATIGSTSVALGSTVTTIAGLTLTTPNLGTPSAITLTNATGLPVSTGISGLGTGVATFLATPTSANFAAALTDESGTGTVAFTASPTFTGTVTVPTPVNPTDAANKAYVDTTAAGFNVHNGVSAATTANLVGTYTAGTTGADGGTGVGAYFKLTATGSLTLDTNYVLALGDRVLVKNQSTQTQNGIYVVVSDGIGGSTTGTGYPAADSTHVVLMRATDYDNSVAGEVFEGDLIYVGSGQSLAATSWVMSALGTSTTPHDGIKIGTDNIIFSQFAGAGSYTANNGITLTGNNFTANLTARLALTGNAIDLASLGTITPGSSGAVSSFITSVTVDTYGRVTGYSTGTQAIATSSVAGIASFSSTNFTITGNNVAVTNVANTVISGYLTIAQGGTGATTAAAARTNLSSTSFALPQKYTATNSALTQTGGQVTWSIPQATHLLTASGGYIIQVKDTSTLSVVDVDIQINDSTGDVTLGWNSASNVSAGAYRVTIIG